MFQLIQTCKYEHIEKFVVYGERHCGTKFLEASLKSFNINQTKFFGHKHWIGWAKSERLQFEMHTLFVCIVRDPYSWITAFFDLPHHVHLSNRMNLEKFMLNEWHSVNKDKSEILEDRNFITGQRYKNIFEMRQVKNQYMLETLSILVRNYVFLSYENLSLNYYNIMDILKHRFNLEQTKDFPVPNRVAYRDISSEHKKIINNNTYWSLENKMGYFAS